MRRAALQRTPARSPPTRRDRIAAIARTGRRRARADRSARRPPTRSRAAMAATGSATSSAPRVPTAPCRASTLPRARSGSRTGTPLLAATRAGPRAAADRARRGRRAAYCSETRARRPVPRAQRAATSSSSPRAGRHCARPTQAPVRRRSAGSRRARTGLRSSAGGASVASADFEARLGVCHPGRGVVSEVELRARSFQRARGC